MSDKEGRTDPQQPTARSFSLTNDRLRRAVIATAEAAATESTSAAARRKSASASATSLSTQKRKGSHRRAERERHRQTDGVHSKRRLHVLLYSDAAVTSAKPTARSLQSKYAHEQG